MFELTGYGLTIFNERYALYDGETWDDACRRVANYIASAEDPDKIKKYQDSFYDEIVNNRFMPGGRIWYGSGRPKSGLINCFVYDPLDSREGWSKSVGDMIITSGMGGGCGFNFSKIRPRGTYIAGTGGEATGAVSLMEIINTAGEVIKGGGGRRCALMFCLNIDHPDLLEFLDKKCFKVIKSKKSILTALEDSFPRLKTEKEFYEKINYLLEDDKNKDALFYIAKGMHDKQLHNANVSVVIPEGKLSEFLDCVKENKEWELTWRDEIRLRINAKDLWDRLLDNAYQSAEPGILNFDLAERMNNIGYYAKITSTNPCGEIPMPPNSVCCLGQLVLPRFVKENGKFDWSQLADTIAIAVRFLDNVLDVTSYPIPETKQMSQNTRRIGLGITGLHDLLLLLGHKYNSQEGLAFVDELMNFVKKRSYEASIFLAAEKGSFPVFNFEGYSKSDFYKSLTLGLKAKIKQYGIRNCAINSIAPTGTISIVCGTSSGVEPIFSYAYERRYYSGDEIKVEQVVHPLFKKFIDDKKEVSHFQNIEDLSAKDHLEIQKVCQKHVDQAISKTINIAKGYPKKDLNELFLEYLPHLKGLTIYVEGSRGAAPLKSLSLEQAQKLLSCVTGTCDL